MTPGGLCLPCPCPLENRNFAQTCSVSPGGSFSCQCQPGYTGPRCDRCDRGFYGRPAAAGGGDCRPCDCSKLGSRSPFDCDEKTGQCLCMPGVEGRDCSQCPAPLHVLAADRTCVDCHNPCVGALLNTIAMVADNLEASNATRLDPTPRRTLARFGMKQEKAAAAVKAVLERKAAAMSVAESLDLLRAQAELIKLEAQGDAKEAGLLGENQLDKLREEGFGLQSLINELNDEVQGKFGLNFLSRAAALTTPVWFFFRHHKASKKLCSRPDDG